MEIKPFFHYHPGEWSLTFSSWSCNLACPWCQNHDISKRRIPRSAPLKTPEELLSDAFYHDQKGLCVSFNEPVTLFEYSLDLLSLGRDNDLFGCWVTNGLVTPAALDMLVEAGLSGMTISVKGDEGTYRKRCVLPGGEEAVWATIDGALDKGVHVEVVNLLIPGVNDADGQVEGVIQRHLEHAGSDVPLHFTRYHPAWKFTEPATPVRTVVGAREKAVKAGVRFAYVGNIPGSKWENTYCPECGRLLLRRGYGRLLESHLEEGDRCQCGELIPICRRI
jgi:pyruvate formate lyase activating enzyme